MSNVIRKDVVEISFETNLKEITKLQDEIAALKKKLTGDMGGDSFEKLKDNANKSTDSVNKLKKSAEGLNNKLKDIGKKGATAAYNGLKKVAGISLKGITAGVSATATALGKVITDSTQAYADFEQLKGGVDTLFKDSAGTVMKYANDAYKTAGVSANNYMETVTSFSASLLQGLDGDTAKAAEISNLAISDMADNANKMGTSMETIQYAYQGFAKQNYMMLDNLKLGYGGSAGEMARLINDSKVLGETTKVSAKTVKEVPFNKIIEAIHTIQENLDITGTTTKEAEKTITGSLNAMKSAWGNLLTAMASGDNLDQCMNNMISTAETFAANIMPVVEKALVGLGTVIERVAPIIEEKLPGLAEKLLPPLIRSAIILVEGIIKALPSIVRTIGTTLVDIFGEQFPAIKKIGEFFANNAGAIAKFIPVLIGLVGAFKLFNGIKSITPIFGKSAGGSGGGGIFSGLANLAKTDTKTILKGIANITLIVTSIGALLWVATKVFSSGVDFKTMLKVTVLVGLIGAVGAGLTKLAGIVGLIPISVVVKGLANIVIVMAGMTAVLWAMNWAMSSVAIDTKKILTIAGLITVLGVVGSVLAVFAGIVGLIPMTVVLTGLASIALAIGAVTALIVAYGKLAEIPGFNDFITKGGETLANLFNQIGKIAGSLIGGLGEGISESLPKIGENIAAFATALEPMFTMFQGVDMSGVGTFFGALSGFMLAMAGEKLLSFITGGTDLGAIGTELNNFATNAQGFFNTVATLPENGFTNGAKVFECLSGLGSLPGSGGLVQWFKGEIDYAAIATGLGLLAGASVVKFFDTVAEMKQVSFDNATKLFECLNGIGNLPHSGGLVQWFTGEVKYADIANGLKALSSEGVKSFFLMVESLSPKAFENTTALFNSLSAIDNLPDSGGIFGWFTGEGDEVDSISKIANSLATFAEKTSGFFAAVNNLNISNLNGLWESLKKPGEITENVSKVVDDTIKGIVEKVKKLPGQMAEGIKSAGQSLADSLVYIWQEAAKAMANPVNKVIEGANWILKEFGSDKMIASWTPYAKGTDGHRGGNALVNDGRGAELVQMPNGRTFIPQGRNVFIPNAPTGMKVLPAEQTARLLGRRSPTFRYANGTGDIDIWDYLDNAKGLVSAVSKKYVSYEGLSGYALSAGKGMVSTITGQMSAWAEKLFDEFGAKSIADYVASAGVEQWRSTVIRALKMEGQYSAANVERTLYQMQTESGGNPRAINLWDSNAKAGIPSKGLMQVIGPTFQAYARAGFDKNIYDPLSNILASVRYAVSRYGSLANAYRGVGYSNGVGSIDLSSYTPESSSTVINSRNKETVESNTYAPVFNLTINGSVDSRAQARQVKQWIQEAMDDMFENMNRKARVGV